MKEKIKSITSKIGLILTLLVCSFGMTTPIFAESETQALNKIEDIVHIYVNSGILYVENALANTTVVVSGFDSQSSQLTNDSGTATFLLSSLTDKSTVEGLTVQVTNGSGQALTYDLKEIPISTQNQRAIDSSLVTIQNGEYYTKYLTDINGDSYHLNHTLTVESGGVLYIGGKDQTSFSVGYAGEGTLEIRSGGAVSIQTFYHYNGYQTLISLSDSKGTIYVNGGLYQVKTGLGTGQGIANSPSNNNEGSLIIDREGIVDIITTRYFSGWGDFPNLKTKEIGRIEVIDGTFSLSYLDFLGIGGSMDGTAKVLSEIFLHPEQKITINGMDFSSYSDNLGNLPSVYTDGYCFIYYNWDGEYGYYYPEESVTFEYGATTDLTGLHQTSEYSGLNTKIPGQYNLNKEAIDTSIYQSNIQDTNKYQLNPNMMVADSVKVLKATVLSIEEIEPQTVAYGGMPTLPDAVEVILNNNESISIPVTWSMSDYVSTQLGNQVINGTLEYPDYVNSDQTIQTTVNVSKATVLSMAKIEPQTVAYGGMPTLPDAVEVILNNNESIVVPVTWSMSDYVSTQLGNQVINGTLKYPDYVSSDLTIQAEIIVEKKQNIQPTPEKSNTPALPSTGVQENELRYGLWLLGSGFALFIIFKKREQM